MAGVNFWSTVSTVDVGTGEILLDDTLPGDAIGGAVVFAYSAPLIRPLRVYGARRYVYDSRIETPILMMARLDYEALPNKYTPGTFTQFFYDPQLRSGQMNIWPAPSSYYSGFRFTAQRPIDTLTDLSSIPDFPDEWFNALAYNLAVDLWPEHNQGDEAGARTAAKAGTFQAIKLAAAEKLQTARGWDREPESILFGPAMAPGYRRG